MANARSMVAAALACTALLAGCPSKKSDSSPPAEQATDPQPPAAAAGDAAGPAAHDAAPHPMTTAQYCEAVLPAAEVAEAIGASTLTAREQPVAPPAGMIECHLQAQDDSGWIAHSIDLFIDCRPHRPSMTALRARAEQLVQNGGQTGELDLGQEAVVAEAVLLDQPSTTILFHHASRPCAVTLTGSFGAAAATAELAGRVHQAMADTPLP